MDRRGFLKFLSAGVAGIALERAIPLGRVWSFPKKIVIAPHRVMPPEMFMGVDWGFGITNEITVRSMWRREPNGGIWVRRETLDANGAATELHGWQLDSHTKIPIVLTAAFRRGNFHTPS